VALLTKGSLNVSAASWLSAATSVKVESRKMPARPSWNSSPHNAFRENLIGTAWLEIVGVKANYAALIWIVIEVQEAFGNRKVERSRVGFAGILGGTDRRGGIRSCRREECIYEGTEVDQDKGAASARQP